MKKVTNTLAGESLMAKKTTWVLWSDEEVKLLKKLFPKGKAREVASKVRTILAKIEYDARKCREHILKRIEN